MPKRYLVTAALPYANGLKHIGHLAGAYLPADIFVRFLKAQKKDVVFVCGSDEHGTAIPLQAMKENTTPQSIINKYHPIIEQNFKDLGIQFDIYHRTSSPIHFETSQDFFLQLYEKKILETKETEQFYDENKHIFLADRYIKGTCPQCHYNNAFGDQCEKCGTSLSPELLLHPQSTLSGHSPIKKKTTHWYLPLHQYESELKRWILEEHKNDWRPTVLGQCKSWLDTGLMARAVTRDLDWGIPLPLQVPNREGKVLYVWFDAPIGYISATKQWAIHHQKDWEPYWKDKDTAIIHFIGKDNIVFHCIIFPTMLQLYGYQKPTSVVSNEFMNLEGDKMSTSRGWSIEMDDYINDWIKPANGGPQMADALRFYLTSIAPENKDSEFTWKGFQDAVNNELVAIFANFINRTLVLMHKLCKSKVPKLPNDIKTLFKKIDEISVDDKAKGVEIKNEIAKFKTTYLEHTYHYDSNKFVIDDSHQLLIEQIYATRIAVTEKLHEYKFREALSLVINLSRTGNIFMQTEEPWILAKRIEDPALDARLKERIQLSIDICIYLCLQLSANLAILIQPFLPFTAEKICFLLKVQKINECQKNILDWENAGKINLLSEGYRLRAPELLFRKIEDDEITIQKIKLKEKSNIKNNTSLMNTPITSIPSSVLSTPPLIQFEDFSKVNLQIATIIEAKKVEKADKLLQLQIELGHEKRTILSGIALHYTPEEIIGKQVVVVTNLTPRKMKGIESNGMILMAEDNQGKLQFISPQQVVPNGTKVS